jgi:hypothetical protein
VALLVPSYHRTFYTIIPSRAERAPTASSYNGIGRWIKSTFELVPLWRGGKIEFKLEFQKVLHASNFFQTLVTMHFLFITSSVLVPLFIQHILPLVRDGSTSFHT